MSVGFNRQLRRSLSLAVVGVLAVGLTACTGRGGGQLPASAGFTGPASFGFSLSCEDKGGLNPPTGQLRIQLSYTDHGSNLLGSSFSIHGTVDEIDPVLESALCIGQNPPPVPNELIFLGRYRLTSSAPARFPATCADTTPTCRFEVMVRDNDDNGAPSASDWFQIKLSSATARFDEQGTVVGDEIDPATLLYTRAGTLSSGNLTVD